MNISFRVAENRVRWAYTDGLRLLNQQECAVQVSWPEHDGRDLLMRHFFQFVESYLTHQPKRILSGQTLRYGWTTVRFVRDEHNVSGTGTETLLIEELQNPFAEEERSYGQGMGHALTLLQVQHEAIRRNTITGEAISPHRSQRALTCTRVTPQTVHHLRPLRIHRAYQADAQQSGWFIGCCERDHDHDDPDQLAMIHLHHLVRPFPGLFPYLAMPRDTLVVFEVQQAILFRPGEQEGQPDPKSLLVSLP